MKITSFITFVSFVLIDLFCEIDILSENYLCDYSRCYTFSYIDLRSVKDMVFGGCKTSGSEVTGITCETPIETPSPPCSEEVSKALVVVVVCVHLPRSLACN